MSLKTRGEEALVTISSDVSGVATTLRGSMQKTKDFTSTPRTDIKEDDYLGELETDLDIQHHGWDLEFSVDTTDAAVMEYTDGVIAAEDEHRAHPNTTITVIYTFREPGVRGKIAVFHGVFLKQDNEQIPGRKDIIKCKFSGKCKRRELLAA